MHYPQTTQVPNVLLDVHLPQLTESELKVLLVVIRQTIGWIDKKNGGRKLRDRISRGQFQQKTGLSKRIITKAVQSLCSKGLLRVTGYDNTELMRSEDRKGKNYLFYTVNFPTPTSAKKAPELVQKVAYNKTNYSKLNASKGRTAHVRHIGEFAMRGIAFQHANGAR